MHNLNVFKANESLVLLALAVPSLAVYFVYHSRPATEARLHSPDTETRCAAAADLAERGTEAQSALPALKAMLNDTQCTRFGQEAGGQYLQAVGGIDAVIDVTRTGNLQAQRTAYRQLWMTVPDHLVEWPKLGQAFAEGLKNEDFAVRYEVTAGIRALGPYATGITSLGPRTADVVPDLENLLTDSNPDLRLSAIKALAKIRSFDALCRALANPYPDVRYEAISALGGMSTQEFGDVVSHWYEIDPDETDAAREKRMSQGPPGYGEFKGYGPAAIPALVGALDDTSEVNATQAAASLGFLHHQGLPALEALEHAVHEAPHLSTRIAALHSIAEIGFEGMPFMEEETWDLNSSVREEARRIYRTMSEQRPKVVCPAQYSFCVPTQYGLQGIP